MIVKIGEWTFSKEVQERVAFEIIFVMILYTVVSATLLPISESATYDGHHVRSASHFDRGHPSIAQHLAAIPERVCRRRVF